MIVSFLCPILLGALLNLDKQVFGPFMVNRPLVTGLVIGFVIGDVYKGIWMGMSVELLWLATMPLGGSLTPNGGLAVTAALTGWAGQALFEAGGFPPPGVSAGLTNAGLVLSFLTVPVWARAFIVIDRIARKAAPSQVAGAWADLAAGRDPHFFRRNLIGVGVNYLAAVVCLLVAVLVNMFLLKLVAMAAPQAVLVNLGFTFTFIPFLGLFGMAVFIESKTVTHYLGGLLASLLVLSAI
ncbi:hypothetical protein C4J81_04560 [Deltaproteobacteria bacterium Smac51]|nr:hypothetical protein C4J81_04560 [Deltaproteobacteria bacterium Smac51]